METPSPSSRPPHSPAGQQPAPALSPRLLAGMAVALAAILGAFMLGRWLHPVTGRGVTERSLLLLLGCGLGLAGLGLCTGAGRWQKIQQLAARYRNLHSGIGITAGSLLAMGFLAGTVTLFAGPLQQWSQPSCMTAPLPLADIRADLSAAIPGRGGASIQFPRAGSILPPIAGPDTLPPVRYQLMLTSPGMARIDLASGPELPLGLPAPYLVPPPMQPLTPGGTAPAGLKGCQLVPSPVPSFIGGLHRRMGLPLPEPWAMPFVGLLCLFYGLALLSGVILMLPGIWRTLMTVRLEGHARRFWLDMHSLLGLCTLPFHLVIALTTALFAFLPFLTALMDGTGGPARQHSAYPHIVAPAPISQPALHTSTISRADAPADTQRHISRSHDGQTIPSLLRHPPLAPMPSQAGRPASADGTGPLLTPLQALTRLRQAAPDFQPLALEYMGGTPTPTSQAERIALHAPLYDADDPSLFLAAPRPLLQAIGTDAHGGPLIGWDRGSALLDPHTGHLLESEDLPGRQTPLRQVLTWCLALHFGSFGGEFVRWLYVGLGLCGVGFFHTANQLWLNSHRRKAAGQARPLDTTATLWLSRMSEGSLLGCLLGLSALIALSPALFQLHPLASMAASGPGLRGPVISGPVISGSVISGLIMPDPVMLKGWQHVSLLYYGLFGLAMLARCLLSPRLCRSLVLGLSAACLTVASIMAVLHHAVLQSTGTLSLTIALALASLGLWAGAICLLRQRRPA